MNRKETLDILCNGTDLYYCTWAPGDGITRYRFFNQKPTDGQHQNYFGPLDDIYTALGIKEAETYARGYRRAYFDAINKQR